jgi:hypothetical protein
MENNQTQTFLDLIVAAESLVKPWRFALLATNLLWAAVVLVLLLYHQG